MSKLDQAVQNLMVVHGTDAVDTMTTDEFDQLLLSEYIELGGRLAPSDTESEDN